jgi:hypothetical protein
MHALAKDEVQKLPRGDVQLAGISWLPDMSLAFTLLLSDGRRARLLCTFAHYVRIRLEFEERAGGYPLSWDIKYSELPDGGWHVLMDFAHTGSVEFDCAELHFEYVTNAA